jgi:DNA-binding NarL/FixJ family response regulator
MLMLSCESSTLRILVVDDHDLTRMSLQIAFSCEENIQVVGLAKNGQEAVEMVKNRQPDVIILDLQMPVMDGWSAANIIKDISPDTQIIAYSSVEDNSGDGMANMDAFCKKDVSTNELIGLARRLGERATKA